MIRASRIGRRLFAAGLAGSVGGLALGVSINRGARGDDVIKSRSPSPVSLRRIAHVPLKAKRAPNGSSALAFAWSPNGRRLAVSFEWGFSVAVFDTSTWTEVSRFTGETSQLQRTMGFLSDSELITDPQNNYSEAWVLAVYDVETGQVTRRIDWPRGFETGMLTTVALTSSRRFVAVHVVRMVEPALLFEAASSKFIGRLGLPEDASGIEALAAGPGDRLAAAASLSGRSHPNVRKHIYLIDAATNSVDRILDGHIPHVASLAWSPDGRLIASGAYGLQGDGPGKWIRDPDPIRIWNVASGEMIASFTGVFEAVRRLAWHPSSEVLATGSGRGDDTIGSAIRFWSMSEKRMIFEYFTPDRDSINALSFHPSTGHLVWGWGGALEVFEVLGLA